MKKTLTKLDYTPYMYEDTDYHTVRISNTVKSLSLIGNKVGLDNNLKQQLVNIENVGSNVEELGPYCCYDCQNLTAVNAPNVKKYGEYSFANSNISAMAPLQDGSTIFAIGDHAFENTQLTSVNIALSGKNIIDPDDPENGYQGCRLRNYDDGPYVGNYAFKDCKQLKSVTIKEHPDIGTGMFEGCTALTSFTVAKNYGACVGEHAFRGCTALSSITFPEKWEMVSKDMFDGCTALTAVNFSNSNNTHLVTIENNAFNGCTKLSNLTLPKSISALDTLSENAFSGSSLKKVTFSGVSDSIFEAFKSQDEKFAVMPEDHSTTSNFKYGIWYLNRIKNMAPYAINNHIPLVIKECSPGCGFCTTFNKKTFNTKKFQEECAKRPYLFMECLWYQETDYKMTSEETNYLLDLMDGYTSQAVRNKGKRDIPWDSRQHTFVIFSALWKKPDGSWVAHQWRTSGSDKETSTDAIFKRLDGYFSGYKRDTKYNNSGYTPAQYVPFSGWGLKHNCELRSSNNTQYTFDSASNTIVKGSSPISQIQQERSVQFRTSTPEKTRVVTVALDYSGTSHNKLPGMVQDATDMENILRAYSTNITKLTNSAATVSAVKNAVTAAVDDTNCDLLIFHFSGHGSGGTNGKSSMVLYDKNLADSAFWKLIEHARCRVLCIFACCHAGTMFKAGASDDGEDSVPHFQETTDFGKSALEYFNGNESAGICAASDTPNLLVWSACTDGEVSWMYSTSEVQNRTDGITRTGHSMINHIVNGFDADKTYKEIWNLVPSEEKYTNADGSDYIYKGKPVYVHPQLSELGQSFQSFKVFT